MQVDLRRENDWLQPEVPEGLASSQQAFFPPPLLCPWSGSGVRDCPLIEALLGKFQSHGLPYCHCGESVVTL